eukprot:1584364-Amphidinium_carterae.1
MAVGASRLNKLWVRSARQMEVRKCGAAIQDKVCTFICNFKPIHASAQRVACNGKHNQRSDLHRPDLKVVCN